MSIWSTGTNTIQEVDTNKNLTLQMLKLRKQGGGTEYFVRKNDVKLGTKSVTQNGTYTAAADGKYGFSQFSVNVRGGNGSADSHGKPTGGDIKPGGAGSAVVGTDPETGNDVVVGVDEDGQLVNTSVPSGIKIVTPPTKTDYAYQEDMDYSGIVVSAIKKDGTTFTDATYPTGHIPMQELIFPVEKAPAATSNNKKSSSTLPTNYTQPIEWTDSEYLYTTGWYHQTGGGMTQRQNKRQFSGGVRAVVYSDGYTFVSTTTQGQYTHRWLRYRHGDSSSAWGNWDDYGEEEITGWNTATVNGDTFYYKRSGDNPSMTEESSITVYGEGPDENTMWTILFGTVVDRGTAAIPVKWNNPYTGNTHQDTFDITSTPADGDAHTSTGSSGTEGSGGGGTF